MNIHTASQGRKTVQCQYFWEQDFAYFQYKHSKSWLFPGLKHWLLIPRISSSLLQLKTRLIDAGLSVRH